MDYSEYVARVSTYQDIDLKDTEDHIFRELVVG